MSNMCVGIAGSAGLAALGLVLWTGVGQAGDAKTIAGSVNKIAASIKADEKDAAAKEAAALTKKTEELGDTMNMFKVRSKGGLGVGPKPGSASQDGIELLLIDIARDTPTANQMKKEAGFIEEMAYQSAAIAEVTKNWTLKKEKGAMNKKNWEKYTGEMVEASLALAKAANKKGAQEVKAAAAKLNTTCTNCHMIFRDKAELMKR